MSESNTAYITKTLEEFADVIQNHSVNEHIGELDGKKQVIIFISIGTPDQRAKVWKEVGPSFDKTLDRLKKRMMKLVGKFNLNPYWVKLDLVTEVNTLPFIELEKEIAKTRRNYFRYGIAFDDDFRLAFLEQEINGNAMIRSVKKSPLRLDEKNINFYMQQSGINRLPFVREMYTNKHVYTFKTKSFFKSYDDEMFHELYSDELMNGIRQVPDLKTEVKQLIKKSTYFLAGQVKESGKFEYGYFSAFAKDIPTYNILRHSSTLYAMAEGYEKEKDGNILQAIEKGITYLIDQAIVYKEDAAFVVDYANDSEIKLGSNATAILALTKYMEVTNSTKYVEIAQALARGILKMKTVSGGFIHVLTYPSFEIKELHRIVYYEGEAVFSLLRLYALDKEEIWLNEVKQSFDYFMEKEYWKHHDHWLSYAANELTIYEPRDEYFEFGLKNCNGRLNFIYHRETTYPTFLELTMAAYKMIKRIKELKKLHLLKWIDEDFLYQTVDQRAEYQRCGFFYPEVAMYMKTPSLIVDGFFIRHHSFRVRIDDVEHYLSGYCQYDTFRL